MNQTEYERMAKIFNYVFSAAPNTQEREKRLAEIGEEDSNKLWDFYCGICSGRIKEPEYTNEEHEANNISREIKSYEDFLRALRCSNASVLFKLRRSNPETYAHYVDQLETSFAHKNTKTSRDIKRLMEEKKKRSEIMEIWDTRERHNAIYENMALFRR